VRALAAASLIALFALPGQARAAGAPTGADATWDWYWQGAHAPAQTATDEGLGTVYLYAEGGFGDKVIKAIAALREQGTQVEALAGEPVWAKPRESAGLLEFVRAARSQDVDAIHLDIEPYSLRLWQTDRERLMHSYFTALTAAKRAAGDVPVNADIPYWYEPPIIRKILDRVDAITVMDYRDTADAAIEGARQEMQLARKAGKRATIGLETGDVKPASITFFQEGRGPLVDAITQIEAAYSDNPAFDGIAVHDAASLAAL
jgi:hypothetical protein